MRLFIYLNLSMPHLMWLYYKWSTLSNKFITKIFIVNFMMLMIYHFFFFLPFLAPASFSILMIYFCFAIYCFCRNYCHYWSNCSFLVFILSSIASDLNFLVCLLSNKTPEISSSLLILFLSIYYI